MSKIVFGFCVSFIAAMSVGPALAQCAGGVDLPKLNGKRIVLVKDTLIFRTSVIKLDIDGSPSAYGLRDQGTENICNGLGPLSPPECRGVASSACTPHCRAAFAAWHASGAKLSRLPEFMCSIGLGGSDCSTPDARLQSTPRSDWFVSETSVKTPPPPGTNLKDWLGTQGAQIDSITVPYFVITSTIRGLPWDATPGDLGVVIPSDGGAPVGFVVGDTGGRLDEGSARLLATLRGVESLPTHSATSALGESIQRLEGELSKDFLVAIFRHSGSYVPNPHSSAKVLSKPAADLANWIQSETTTRLNAIGGVARLKACN